MKANQAFRLNDDAVSPVIAVILMVAITVVLAATVYVWVSGFGAQSSTPSKTIALSSAGAIADAANNHTKQYTVASAASGMKYSDLTLTVNGASWTQQQRCMPDTDLRWSSCAGTTLRATTDVIQAGDVITLFSNATSASTSLSGQSLRMLDTQANSVILTLVIG